VRLLAKRFVGVGADVARKPLPVTRHEGTVVIVTAVTKTALSAKILATAR
jgi:hypothetical protein